MARRVTLTPANSQINLTSLIDISLTLLTLFIIVTPFMQQSLDVQLPTAGGKTVEPGSAVTITLAGGGRLLVDGRPVPRDSLGGLLRNLLAERSDKSVYLEADRSVPYGQVVEVMDRVREAGVANLGIITQPQ